MRKAVNRLGELYKTQLGQDVIETLLGASIAAGGQAMFTDMTPEQILMATGAGVGASAIGRPIVGRLGNVAGSKLAKAMPGREKNTQQLVASMMQNPIVAAKFAPYAGAPAMGQVGNVVGRQYGDNLVQALVALAAPSVFTGESDAA